MDDVPLFEPIVAGMRFTSLGKNFVGRHEFEVGEGRVRAVVKQQSTLTDYTVYKRIYDQNGNYQKEVFYCTRVPSLLQAQERAVELLNELAVARSIAAEFSAIP